MSGWGGGNEWTGPAPSQGAVIERLRSSNQILRDELRAYQKRSFRAFWRGTCLGAVLAFGAMVASAAWGETITIGGIYVNGAAQFGTTVSIEPSGNPGELAVVTLTNEHVNDAGDNGERFIGIPGLAVGVTFTWDADGFSGADRITVRPPEGITCLPADCSVTVMEGMTGTVVLLDWVGM